MKTLVDAEIEELKKVIAKRLEQVRKEQSLTQVELSEQLGASQNMVYRAEAELKLSLESFLYIIYFFHRNYKMSLEWILAPNTKGIPAYTTELKNTRRQTDSDDRKRSDILKELVKQLAEQNLLPEKE